MCHMPGMNVASEQVYNAVISSVVITVGTFRQFPHKTVFVPSLSSFFCSEEHMLYNI